MADIGETLFSYLVQYTQNILVIDIGSIARSRAMVKVSEVRYRWYYRRTIRVFQIVLGSFRESEILLGEIY